MAPKQGTTRREMLRGAAGAAAAASIGHLAGCFPTVGGRWTDAAVASTCGCSPPDGGASADDAGQSGPVAGASTVVTIQNPASLDASFKTPAPAQVSAVQSMVDTVLSTLAGGAANPWPVLLPGANSCTRIGLKLNCLNPNLPTSRAVVRAIISNLITNLPACAANIVVWDRTVKELNYGKYTADDLQGARLVGTTGSFAGEAEPGYTNPNYGSFQGNDGTPADLPGLYSPRLSRILTEQTDITINCPVLKKHGVSGVTAALKNIYGIIDIPKNFHTQIHTALPALYNIPQIRNSLKLTIVDALRAETLMDTSDPVDCAPGRIFASLDPLALDHYALDLLNQLRLANFGKGGIDSTLLGWLDNAYQLGLGTKDYTLIECPTTSDGIDASQSDDSQSG